MCTFSRPPFGEVAPDFDLLRPHPDEKQEAEQVEQQVLKIVQYCFALLKCHKNENLTPQENLLQNGFFSWVALTPLKIGRKSFCFLYTLLYTHKE